MGKQEELAAGPVVLITGCSKGGMGYALAMAFAEAEGGQCQVIATAPSLDAMEGLDAGRPLDAMEGLDAGRRNVHLLQLNVCSDDSVREAMEFVTEKYGRIDIVVNNAGVHCVAPVAELPLPLLQRTFDTNVAGSLRIIQAVVGGMISRKRGKIVNIGSVTAFANGPWVGGYGASKAALHALSDSLRVELEPFGVQVVVVAPCAIRSNIGVNSSKTLATLPSWKFYKSWNSAIEARASASQLAKSMSARDFARETARVILKERPPRCLTIGYLSGFYTLMYYLPLRLRDWIMKLYFGV